MNMQLNMLTGKLPRKSLILLAACLGGLLLFIFAGIIPMQIAMHRLDQQIRMNRITIEEQRDFAPIYEAIQKRVQQKTIATGSRLILPESQKLTREQVANLGRMMRDIAVKTSMNSVSINPQLNTSDSSPSVSVHHVIQGSYVSFRKYLMYIAQLPYCDRIEAVKIRETANGLDFNVKMRFLVA